MPRKYRITEVGFHHVVNRGVERRNIFYEEEDFDVFLDNLKYVSKTYKLTIHAYCIMSNHYHLLIETTQTNISSAIRYLNASYSNYFNKKHKRYGHLWQSRFFSNYLFDDEHFWIIAKYIEQNPIKAKMVNKIQDYRYQSLFQYMYKQKHFEVLKYSKILNMQSRDYYDFINSQMSDDYLQKVYTEPKQQKDEDGNILVLSRRIDSFFKEDIDINRVENIQKAFEYGYTKAEIANFLNISNTMVAKYL